MLRTLIAIILVIIYIILLGVMIGDTFREFFNGHWLIAIAPWLVLWMTDYFGESSFRNVFRKKINKRFHF